MAGSPFRGAPPLDGAQTREGRRGTDFRRELHPDDDRVWRELAIAAATTERAPEGRCLAALVRTGLIALAIGLSAPSAA